MTVSATQTLYLPCPACDGAGSLIAQGDAPPALLVPACPDCGGEGQVYGAAGLALVVCPACDGYGVVRPPRPSRVADLVDAQVDRMARRIRGY